MSQPIIQEVYSRGPKQSNTQVTSIHQIINWKNKMKSYDRYPQSDSVLKKKSLSWLLSFQNFQNTNCFSLAKCTTSNNNVIKLK